MSEVIRPVGALTLETVSSQIGLLDAVAGCAAVTVDLAGVTETDSSAVALLLAWCRRARAQGGTLDLVAVPEGLRKLIAVYGLTDLLL